MDNQIQSRTKPDRVDQPSGGPLSRRSDALRLLLAIGLAGILRDTEALGAFGTLAGLFADVRSSEVQGEVLLGGGIFGLGLSISSSGVLGVLGSSGRGLDCCRRLYGLGSLNGRRGGGGGSCSSLCRLRRVDLGCCGLVVVRVIDKVLIVGGGRGGRRSIG